MMGKIVDKNYCMSSFLTFRYIADENRIFKQGLEHDEFTPVPKAELIACSSAEDIDRNIRQILDKVDLSKAALLLSGGMDSAILASYMPKGTRAYTAKCSAPGAIDETERARAYCKKYGLEHVIVDITWEDYLESIDALMLRDGCSVFANEPQVYKLTKKIQQDGAEIIIFGDNADMAFGGYDRLLLRDWTYDDWIKRFTFVDPFKILKNPVSMNPVYSRYKSGESGIDYITFMNEIFAMSSTGAYQNAFRLAEMDAIDPYARLTMKEPLDLKRVRSGESKYLIRQLFRMKYPDMEIPEKIAMPRAVDQWLAEWEGPKRGEFLPNCIDGMTGEQKFLIYSLERFMNLIGLEEE